MALRAAFVGLGNIGKPMAKRLVKAGFETAVFDVAPAPVEELVQLGARAARSPRDAAEGCDAIGVCVRDDADVLDVCLRDDGLLAGARPGAVIAIHSTVLPRTAERVATEAAPRGIGVLDACVSGGAAGAEHGALVVMAGGEADALERARPYLEAFARKVVHAGPTGDGCKAKLCNNLLTYLAWTAAFEAHTLARASGLSQECFEEVTTATGNLTGLPSSARTSCPRRRARATPCSRRSAATSRWRRRIWPGRCSSRASAASRCPAPRWSRSSWRASTRSTTTSAARRGRSWRNGETREEAWTTSGASADWTRSRR
jgi:3-hydroxyisobutyrate dehydrogenase